MGCWYRNVLIDSVQTPLVH